MTDKTISLRRWNENERNRMEMSYEKSIEKTIVAGIEK